MKQFPVFFTLRGQPCLVVGGGEEAAAKVRLLSAADADIALFASSVCDELQRQLDAGTLTRAHATSPWQSGYYRLVIVADASPEQAKSISRDCIERGIPVNVVDKPGLCSFTVPAIVDRAPITIAISTGGASPIMARSIKGQIEALLPSALGALATLYASRRAKVKRLIKGAGRRTLWERAHHGEVAQLAYAGNVPGATEALDRLIEQGPGATAHSPHVTLMDARHADPDQITLGELRRLQCTNTLVCDEQLPHALRELCRRDAARHTLLTATPSVSVVAKQLANLAEPGQRTVLLVTGSWFTASVQQTLATRLRAQGIVVENTREVTAVTARHANAL